jgi:hypothetical protein
MGNWLLHVMQRSEQGARICLTGTCHDGGVTSMLHYVLDQQRQNIHQRAAATTNHPLAVAN